MIQPHELRINNYLHHKNFGLIKVDGIDADNVYFEHETAYYYFDFTAFKPIPITEDELIKLGFVSNPYEDRYEIQNIHVECDKTKGETLLWLYGAPYVKHIHQLQNLYFALTNKELRYNE
jgi:hypothetical protein